MAIVTANLLAARLGPGITVATAFVFIGLDLTFRDGLHDAWAGNGLRLKMFLLLATGSAISWLLNRDAGLIAVASAVSFMAAGSADGIVYQLLAGKPWRLRVNGSNLAGAAVDSLVFPTLAFGALLWPVVAGQFVAKVVGGFLWAFVLSDRHVG